MTPDFTKLWNNAHQAGLTAGEAAVPKVMLVEQAGRIVEEVLDGPCGFAWIVVSPGNSSFARWAKMHRGARRAYGGGMQVKWVSEFNQSITRKDAYARAFARVLQDVGIKAYPHSRMD